METPYCDHLFK